MAFVPTDMQVTSEAFEPHGAVPSRHVAEGENLSPPLAWSGAPQGTRAFAVFCHDPDAPLVQNGSYGFVHWVLYNLPADTTKLVEGTEAGTPGSNDFGNQGYGGPMPPEGHGVHNYYFWVLALDQDLALPAGLSMPQLLEKIEPHLLGMNRLMGTYQR